MAVYTLSLILVRKLNDGSRGSTNPSDIIITKKSARNIVMGQRNTTYAIKENGQALIKLKNWDEAYSIYVKDKLTGKEYKIKKSILKANSSTTKSILVYQIILDDPRQSMRVDFYAEVFENNAGNSSSLRIISDVEYQIDYPSGYNEKPIHGVVKPVSGLEFNHKYTKEFTVIRDINYRVYLVGRNKKPYNPHLRGQSKAKPLYLNISSKESIKQPHIQKYQLQTFLQFKVKFKKGTGVPKKAKVQLLDYKGNIKKTLSVNERTGLTDVINADYKRKVKLLVDGKPISAQISLADSQGNVTPNVENYTVTLTIPTIPAPTVVNKPKNTAIALHTGKLPIVYDLVKKELIVLKEKDFKEFDDISSKLGNLVKISDEKRKAWQAAYDKGKSAEEVKDAASAMQKAEDAVKEKLNSSFGTKAKLKEVFLVERYAGNDQGRGNTQLVRRYLENDAYTRYRNNRINQRSYDIDISAASGVNLTTSPSALNTDSLIESVKQLSVNLKKEWQSESYSKDLDLNDLTNGLIDSANELSRSIKISERFDIDMNAQWLRAVGGASAEGSAVWNPKKGDIELSGGFNVSGKLVLCEGIIDTKMAIPSKKGWQLKTSFDAAGEVNLGAIRVIIACDFYGFTGVKASLEGSASVKVEGGTQKIIAAAKQPTQTASKMWDAANKQRTFNVERSYERVEAMDDRANSKAKVEVTAFAGAEAGITPAASIEWLNPEVKDFRAFAKISATVAGNAGIGFSGSFYVFYESGKFKVRAQAALCFGFGGKGGLTFEIDSALILEFARWLSYQLLSAKFRTLVYIQCDAFEAISKLSVLVFGNSSNITNILHNIEFGYEKFLAYIDKDEARMNLAQKIVSKRDDDWLKYATPEAKGMLLYQLTRHAKVSHINDYPTASVRSVIPTRVDIDLLEQRKYAIIVIFETVTTADEWQNVVQHMTLRGKKGNLGKNEGDIVRLLNYGAALANETDVLALINTNSTDTPDTGSYYVDQYIKMRQKIAPSYPKGIEVVKNTDAKYDIYKKLGDYTSPHFYAAANPNQYDPKGFEDNDRQRLGTDKFESYSV